VFAKVVASRNVPMFNSVPTVKLAKLEVTKIGEEDSPVALTVTVPAVAEWLNNPKAAKRRVLASNLVIFIGLFMVDPIILLYGV